MQVAIERRVAVHLDAEILEDRHAPRRADAAGRLASQLLGDTRALAVLRDRECLEGRPDTSSRRLDVLVEPGLVDADPPARGPLTIAASSQASVRRLHLQVDVGQLGGLGAARIDDDQRALRVL